MTRGILSGLFALGLARSLAAMHDVVVITQHDQGLQQHGVEEPGVHEWGFRDRVSRERPFRERRQSQAARDRRTSAPRRAATPSAELPKVVRFTFDLETGAFRRKVPAVLGRSMHGSGMDVSWTDIHAGVFGTIRRFTVEGSAHLVGKLIDELAESIGWQPGLIPLPALAPR